MDEFEVWNENSRTLKINFLFHSYYHKATTDEKFKRYIPRLPFDTSRILGGLLEVKNVMSTISENTFVKLPQSSMDDFDANIFRTATKPYVYR